MTPIAKKVQYLIALATSPNDNEARTAAILACSLIREHGLEICEPGTKAPPSIPAAETETTRRIKIRSRFNGWCRSCGEAYDAGDLIAWARDAGAVHVECDRRAA